MKRIVIDREDTFSSDEKYLIAGGGSKIDIVLDLKRELEKKESQI